MCEPAGSSQYVDCRTRITLRYLKRRFNNQSVLASLYEPPKHTDHESFVIACVNNAEFLEAISNKKVK